MIKLGNLKDMNTMAFEDFNNSRYFERYGRLFRNNFELRII